ncbi:MAG TPA: hypothetical protein VF054_05935 [Micromonosporaceae bacterium]
MDMFARTFLAAANEAAVPVRAISRHIPLFRRCVGSDASVLVVARCVRPDRPLAGEHLLLLTRGRLAVSRESRTLHRARVELDAMIRELREVVWAPDPRRSGLELALTGADGVRQRFWITTGHPKQVWRLDALLNQVFSARRPALPVGRPARR